LTVNPTPLDDAAPDLWERLAACTPVVVQSLAWLGFTFGFAAGQAACLAPLCCALFFTGLLVRERWSDPYGC
jgi:hypothetical protein